MNFTFSAKAAQDFGGASYAKIDSTGKYTGTIQSLELKENQETGSKGLSMVFKSDQGATAKFYINTEYRAPTGDIVSNLENISALLCCLRMRETGQPVPFMLEEYDFDSKSTVKTTKPCYVELHGKRIGLLIRMEKRTFQNKEGHLQETTQPAIFYYFEANTEYSPREILNRATQPEDVAKKLEWLIANPVKGEKPTPQPPKKPSNPLVMLEPVDDFSNDIPF